MGVRSRKRDRDVSMRLRGNKRSRVSRGWVCGWCCDPPPSPWSPKARDRRGCPLPPIMTTSPRVASPFLRDREAEGQATTSPRLDRQTSTYEP